MNFVTGKVHNYFLDNCKLFNTFLYIPSILFRFKNHDYTVEIPRL